MPRNLDYRVEVAFPVLDPLLQAQVREILEIQLSDTVKARRFLPDGTTARVRPDGRPSVRAQERLYELTAARTRLASTDA
jgi:polyphosphate kinase